MARRTPFLLSDKIALTAGKSALGNMANLTSPYRGPIAIDEIRFSVEPVRAAGGFSTPAPLFSGGAIRAKFSVGRIDLTNGFVPIGLFGSAVDDSQEQQSINTTGLASWEFSYFRWVLPTPLILNPGQSLIPTLLWVNDFGSFATGLTNINVRIAYAGRALNSEEAIKGKLKIPYVTAFVPDSPFPTISGTNDLRNPFQVPFHVQRLISRQQSVDNADSACMDYSTLPASNTGAIPTALARVKLEDSNGYEIVKDIFDLNGVAEATFRSWTLRSTIAPKQWWVAKLSNCTISATFKPMLSLVGYREEQVSP